jgi:branched-chain amino acid transport system substrate-binding protein
MRMPPTETSNDVTHRLRRISFALVMAVTFAACTGHAATGPTTAPTSPAGAVLTDLKIAFVADLSQDGATQRIAPALQGARLAVDASGLRSAGEPRLDIVPLDTEGTSAGIEEVADRIVGDGSIVATIVGPQLTGQIALGDRLDAAGVPTVSLSTLGANVADQGWSTWRRAVPDVEREARTLVESIQALVGPRATCLLGDGSAASAGLLRAVRDAMTRRPALRLGLEETDPDDPEVIAAILGARCRSVVWGGTPTGGALLRLALVAAGLRSVRLFGGESLKDASFIATAGPRGRGTVAVCPCADLSTSTDLRDQRFIQDYQSSFGVSPGAFAAEAWDVARMLIDVLRSAPTDDRTGVALALSRTSTFEGLARRYEFARNGGLRGQRSAVIVYRDVGVRWIPLGEAPEP